MRVLLVYFNTTTSMVTLGISLYPRFPARWELRLVSGVLDSHDHRFIIAQATLPIFWATFSDHYGRKRVLLVSLGTDLEFTDPVLN
jgi:hypothetical protein